MHVARSRNVLIQSDDERAHEVKIYVIPREEKRNVMIRTVKTMSTIIRELFTMTDLIPRMHLPNDSVVYEGMPISLFLYPTEMTIR